MQANQNFLDLYLALRLKQPSFYVLLDAVIDSEREGRCAREALSREKLLKLTTQQTQ
jgi:hypothetical protein